MKPLILSCLLGGLLSTALLAQGNLPVAYHALSAKVLAIDYDTPNELVNADLSFGLELGYRRQLGKILGLAVPLKVGVIDIGESKNVNFASVDLLAHIYPLGSQVKLAPYLLAGGGIVFEGPETNNTQIPLGLGVNLQLGRNASLGLQGEYRLSNEDLRNNLQLGLGYIYRLSISDTDGDGIPDHEDECPNEVGSAATKGCPDTDGDGIADKKDKCPTEPGTAAMMGCPDTDGDGIPDHLDACPEVAGPKATKGCPDTDGDGVVDSEDACPNVKGDPAHQGCPDTDGDGIYDNEDKCPTIAANTPDGCPLADTDGDGVPDAEDRCPNQAGSAALKGCPDSDGDGIADLDDKCPTQAGPASNQGCPEIREEVVRILEFATQAVQFETGSARLKQESFLTLDEIVRIMAEYPAYSLIISGHTDNVGNAENNQLLSENRAKACRDYLVSMGVAERRMTYVGFGSTKPRADNGSSSGRSLNRRVEFDLRLL